MSASPDDKAPASESHALADRARHRIEQAHETLEAAGVSVHGASFFLIWWRRIGLVRAVGLLVMLLLPAGGYSALFYTATRVIPDWVGDFGVRYEAKETHVDLLHMRVVTRDVSLRADERSEPVFTASEVEFQGSLGTFFRGLFGPGAFYNEITVKQGELHVERSLTGEWNLADFFDRVPRARREAAMAGLYRIRGLYLDRFKVAYTEQVPGNSGGGVIQTAQARVFIDDLTGYVEDLAPA